MSPEALKAVFSPETDEDLITLLTISNFDNSNTIIRIADGYTQRLVESDEEVVYGVRSRSNDYIFLPVTITLPSEEESGVPRCSLSITDVTRYLIPIIRSTILRPPSLKLELVLASSPDDVEISFSQFYINSITYNADSVQCDISMISYQNEPFPCFSFTPNYFPGLF